MPSGTGIVHIKSAYSVAETLGRLQQMLHDLKINLFTVIDHSGAAESVGLTMHPTELAIFGNPQGGTPAMVAVPSLAIDLPMKALVWEDAEGVWISYNDPAYLQQRHGVPEELMKPLQGIGALCAKAAGAAG